MSITWSEKRRVRRQYRKIDKSIETKGNRTENETGRRLNIPIHARQRAACVCTPRSRALPAGHRTTRWRTRRSAAQVTTPPTRCAGLQDLVAGPGVVRKREGVGSPSKGRTACGVAAGRRHRLATQPRHAASRLERRLARCFHGPDLRPRRCVPGLDPGEGVFGASGSE